MKKRANGSITLFSLLSMILVAATLLSLLEGARYLEMNRLAQVQTESALESVFANYNTNLWQTYRLLGCSQSEMEEVFLDYANARYDDEESRLNTLLFQVGEVGVESYTLLTDGDGEVYVAAVAGYMEDNILYEAAQSIYSRYEAMESLQNASSLDFSNIDDAIDALEELSEDSAKSQNITASGFILARKTKDSDDSDNFLEDTKKIFEMSILDLVVEDVDDISDTKIDTSKAVSARQLAEGSGSSHVENTWIDKILLQQYFLTYMSSYTEVKEDHALSYELEYLIGEKDSDEKNLKIVATQLLNIRAVANFAYLLSDSTKVEEAAFLASTLVGYTLNPTVVELVKIAILTGWAYGESILDVRTLLEGKKIPLIKSKESWTLDLDSLTTLANNFATAKESEYGLSYEDYLGILLLFKDENDLAMHAMDVQEETIKTNFEESDFQMDSLVVEATVEVTYNYNPIFYSIENISSTGAWKYKLKSAGSYSYN